MRDAARVGWALKTIRRGGMPQWRVGTGRARHHVEELRAAGWTFEHIAQAAGVSPSTVFRLTRERQCNSLDADAVLAVAVR
jgi:AraC-like DNA-binding protein